MCTILHISDQAYNPGMNQALRFHATQVRVDMCLTMSDTGQKWLTQPMHTPRVAGMHARMHEHIPEPTPIQYMYT